MWARLRLDISWAELLRTSGQLCLPARDRDIVQAELEQLWSGGENDALACLSVRSGFDLLLRAAQFQAGDEVLFSAINIPDMPRIAREHGLTDIPIDLLPGSTQVDPESLRQRISPRSRALVVAPLFGAKAELHEVATIAREHGLLVIEDCAQAFDGSSWRGDPAADVSLFSFGPLKTGTALGGAVCVVRDVALLQRMREVLQRDPPVQRHTFAKRVLRSISLKLASGRLAYGLLAKLISLTGGSLESAVDRVTKGFAGRDLLPQLRQQPHALNLELLLRRLSEHDSARWQRRRSHALRIIDTLGANRFTRDALQPGNAYWFVPLLVDGPEGIVQALRDAGFDVTRHGRMQLIENAVHGCPNAAQWLLQLVLLPCYPELTEAAIDRMCRTVSRTEHSQRT